MVEKRVCFMALVVVVLVWGGDDFFFYWCCFFLRGKVYLGKTEKKREEEKKNEVSEYVCVCVCVCGQCKNKITKMMRKIKKKRGLERVRKKLSR